MQHITYFGLKVYQEHFVKEEEIKQLPFYAFWKESHQGSTIIIDPILGELIYLSDWNCFCNRFIKTGTHRYQKPF